MPRSWRAGAREWWRRDPLDRVRQDVRFTLRGLGRSPGFTATVMLTLALGIGANAAMFSVVDRLMFRSFAYLRDPATVSRVYLQTTSRGRVRTQSTFPYTRYLDLRQWTSSFSEYAGFSEWRLAVGSGGDTREMQVAGVSASFFGFFDARPAAGRFFVAAEDSVPRGENVAVLGYGFWKRELGGADVLGQTLQVGPLVTTVIGVAPEGFVGVAEGEPPALFLPITTLAYAVNQGDAASFATSYHWDWMSVMVRREAGVTAAAASADLTNAFARSRTAQREQDPKLVAPANVAHPRAIAGRLRIAGGPGASLESRTLLWVSGVAAIALLIACANVANLMFARLLGRRREIAMRLALGVSRSRLAAQLLTESLILAALGCIVGVAWAQWVSAALRRLLVHDGSRDGLVADGRTIAFACAVAIVVGIATSIGPTLLAVRGDLAATLRGGARGGTRERSRTRSALLIVQGALSVVLLVGAGLFVRSLHNVSTMRLGWDPEPVLIAQPNFRGLQMDSAAAVTFSRRLLEAAQSIRGVEHAARVNSLPFGTNTLELRVPGIDSVQRLGRFVYQSTTPDYFAVMSTRIIRGRAFTAHDRADAPRVAVVSASMARTIWPGEDAIGKCIYTGSGGAPCTTVIGIAEDAVQNSITDDERLMYYLSDEQPPIMAGSRNRIFLRTSSSDPSAMAERVREELQRVMPGQAYVTVTPLETLVDGQRRSWKLGATMFAAFGALALLVAGIGLYGAIAYDVAQRMHELGVRIALGARSFDIVRVVVGRGIAFAAAGVTIGGAVALIAAPWIQPLLFRESARDPAIYVAVGSAIVLVALAATAVPAVRAIRADPNRVLRSE